ncbi:MAG: hypothetical protein ABSF00_07975 [Candidatus Bathyarchaeia archaeon]
MKSAIFVSILVGAALILVVLASPWYPVATSQVVPQILSYTTQFEVTTGSVEVKETLTAYSTRSVTLYSITTVPFHKILGVVTSDAILVLLALVLVLSTLLDQGIITVPARGRKSGKQ